MAPRATNPPTIDRSDAAQEIISAVEVVVGKKLETLGF